MQCLVLLAVELLQRVLGFGWVLELAVVAWVSLGLVLEWVQLRLLRSVLLFELWMGSRIVSLQSWL